MATVDDIDTQTAVGKFLQRQSVTPKADNQANTADEITAVLQTVATAFLLYPQAALTIILNAKNSLQQIVQADLSVVQFMIAALGDVTNQDIPITSVSDLVDAQTALVALDNLGRVDPTLQPFSRYQAAINRFLNNQLAPTLKRNGTGTFERTGDEARQDLFSILSQFVAAHGIMASMLQELQASVADFQSVDLAGIVSAQTIALVRSSLTQVRSRVSAGTISKTTAAIELLSGAAALNSISNTTDVFDPAVSTGTLPPRTNIVAESQDIAAIALSTAGPWTLTSTPWKFAGTMDPLGPVPQPFNFEIPGPGASGRAYVSSEGLTATFNIPASSKLYLHLDGVTPTEYEIALTSGPTVPIATLISNINTALGANGSCIQNPGTFGFLIFGSTSVTAIVVRSASTGSTGTYSTGPSAHTLLGFVANQTSLPVNEFTSASLAAAIHNQLPSGTVAVVGNKVSIASTLSDTTASSIFFDAAASHAVQGSFGFIGTVESEPTYIELFDGTTVQSPDDIGVYIGSIVSLVEEPAIVGSPLRTLDNIAITDIQGTQIFFDPSVHLPRRSKSIIITSPIVVTVQQMVVILQPFVGTFDSDANAVKRILSPIISNPTTAQLGDANRVLTDIQTRLQNLLTVLQGIVVRADRSQFSSIAAQILSSLEERGLDRAQDLLSSGQFSLFFSLDSSNSSKSNRLLTAMETVATQDLPISTIETDIPDDQNPRGTNPDSTLLPGTELQGTGTLASE